MRYALIMAVTIIRCFEIPTMLTLQNIVCQMYLVHINKKTITKQKIIIGPTKLSKTIVDIPNFI